ncbi:winged helix-turn-helix domain-containing protein [Photobacterium minamisatsumaniensis]|uniref:winged helix-turn-helix domain-containing protein n=1 Tax=Photobacterium minamisatsumaniensis TaxID=2910233 RepID=UPI003D0EA922
MKGLVCLSDSVVFDLDGKKLFKNNYQVKLNAAEKRILLHFIAHHHEILDKAQLLHAGWPNGYVTESSLFGVILSLRNKLGKDVIITVPRLGYRMKIIERKTVKQNRSTVYVFAGILGALSLLALAISSFFTLEALDRKTLINDNTLYALTLLNDESNTFIKHLTRRQSALNVYAVSYGDINSISWCNKTEHGKCAPMKDVTVRFYNWQLPDMLDHLAEGKLDTPLKTASGYHGSSNYFSSYFISFENQLFEVELDMAYDNESDDGEGIALNVVTLDTGSDFILLAQSVTTSVRKSVNWYNSETWMTVEQGSFQLNEPVIKEYFSDIEDTSLLVELSTKPVRPVGRVERIIDNGDARLWLFPDGSLLWVYKSLASHSGILPFMSALQ